MKNALKPLLGFAAFSGTGKTTLLEKLIPLLTKTGLRVGLIKHSHHNFEIDKPGKDSYRLRAAGASPVMLVSSHRRASITEFTSIEEPKLDEQLNALDQSELDLILVEGFKAEHFPKIELHRPSLQKQLLFPNDADIIAIATDADIRITTSNTDLSTDAITKQTIPTQLDINQPELIAAFIIHHFLDKNNDPCGFKPDNVKNNGLISIAQALETIKNSVTPINGIDRVTLKNALKRILDQSVHSSINIPPERNAVMDGYAFSSAEITPNHPFSLTLGGTSWAGKPYSGKCQKGQCIRIFTGAVIPDQADSVIMQENISQQDNNIIFPANTAAKDNIRQVGCDIAKDARLVTAPKRLSAIDIGLLASAGIYDVAVKRKLNIAFLSTGDELCPIGQTLASGQIYDSNRYTLTGLLDDNSFSVNDLGVIADDKQLLKEALLSAAKTYDVIISTGGASVGDADYIKEILDECGQVDFWKIAIKPGKPLAFGKIQQCYFFGLPGNPVSVIATFHKIVQPALQQLLGLAPKKQLSLSAICNSHLKKQKGRQEYQRGVLTQDETGGFQVESAGEQGSNIMSAMSKANCYIVLPVESEGVSMGQEVVVEPFEVLI